MSLTELRDDIKVIDISYKPRKQMKTAQGSVLSCWNHRCIFVPNQAKMRCSTGNALKVIYRHGTQFPTNNVTTSFA